MFAFFGLGKIGSGGKRGGAVAVPTLTWTSGTSTYDPAFNLTPIVEADVVELQIDDNSDFLSLYDSDTNTVDTAEASDGQLTFPGIMTLGYGTTYYARARIGAGAWSNVVSKAMDALPVVPTTWDPATRSSRHTLSNGNLTVTASNANAYGSSIGINSRTGKKYFELACTPGVANNIIAIALSSAVVANNVLPGNTATGVSYGGNGQVRHNNVLLATQVAHTTTAAVVYGCAVDTVAKKVWFSKDGVFVGDPAAGTGGYDVTAISTFFPVCTTVNVDVITLRRLAVEFTGTVPTGFTGWDN